MLYRSVRIQQEPAHGPDLGPADGSWKAVADIFNADAPAMAMPAKK